MSEMMFISQTLTSLKSAHDIAKAMLTIRDATLIQGKILELQGIILSAQESALASNAAQFALVEEKRALEKEVTDLKAWNREKEKYELKRFDSGASAYIPKDEMQLPEASHHICANCYHSGCKSILQGITRDPGRCYVLECHKCGSDLYIHGSWRDDHAPRRKVR